MSNEVLKDELLTGSVEFLDKFQFSSQNKIFTDKEISKVLYIKSRACVLHTEVLDEEVHVSGKITSNLVFVSTEGETVSSNAEIEFNETIKNKTIKQGDGICISAEVIDSSTSTVSVSEVELSTIVELQTKLVSSEKITYVTGGGDGLYVQDDEFKDRFLTSSGKQNLNLEFEIPTRDGINTVLDASCCLKLKNIKARNSIAEIDGTAFYSLFLNDIENNLKIINDECLFNEEVVIDGLSSESTICAKLLVCGVDSEITEGKTILKVSATLCYDVYEEKKLMFVSDAYSTENEINLNVISALQNRFACNFSENTEIVGNISVKDENFEIRKVIGVLPKNTVISSCEIDGEEVLLQGVASFTAVYEDVEDVKDSVDIELPFASKFKNSSIKDDQTISVSACIFDVKAKIRKANEIEISAGLVATFNVFEKNEFAYVSGIEIGEEKQKDDAALIVYVVKKGESLFDVAKKLSVSMADLISQNPALEDENIEGQHIVIYKQKMIN